MYSRCWILFLSFFFSLQSPYTYINSFTEISGIIQYSHCIALSAREYFEYIHICNFCVFAIHFVYVFLRYTFAVHFVYFQLVFSHYYYFFRTQCAHMHRNEWNILQDKTKKSGLYFIEFYVFQQIVLNFYFALPYRRTHTAKEIERVRTSLLQN